MNKKMFIYIILNVIFMISLYFFIKIEYENKIKNIEYNSMKHNIKMNALFYYISDSNNSMNILKDNWLTSINSYLEFMKKKNEDISFFCEFWKIDKLREGFRKNFKKSNVLNINPPLDIDLDNECNITK